MAPGYRERYQLLQNTDEERNTLFEELLVANYVLKDELDKITNRNERDNDAVELYQRRAKEAISEFKALQNLTNFNTYVCVLIDGEEIPFTDHFFQGSTRDGKEAASLLRGEIKDYISGIGMQHDCDFVIYMYADMYAMARKCHVTHEDLDRFVGGFNISHPLLNFIDTGDEQGCTKSKIGEMLRLQSKNVHCKHLVVGASTSDRCGTFLKTVIGNKLLENRITLLQGPPFSRELASLSNHFRTTSFPKVFRSVEPASQNEPVRNHRRSPHAFASSAKHQAPDDRFLEMFDIRNSANGGFMDGFEGRRSDKERGKRSSLRESVSINLRYDEDDSKISPDESPKTTKVGYAAENFKNAPFGFVAHNRKGQRVDVPLTKPDSRMIFDIKQRKLCNDHVFRKKCLNDHCRHHHPSSLSDQEIQTLRDIARHVPCVNGLRCNDPYCHSGHRCPVDPCGFVQDRSCRFPPDLHNTDTSIVNKEAYEKLRSSSHDETRILGVSNRLTKESTDFLCESKLGGESMHRNKSMTFDDPLPIESAKDDFSSSGKSTSHAPIKLSISNPKPAATVTSESVSPLKRTADKLKEEASRESDFPASLVRDPRVGAQKRLRVLSP